MKRILVVLLVVGSLLVPEESFGQDLLITPQNQKYLFTAGTDEAQAALYNPAYLGIFSGGGVLDGYYFVPSSGQLSPSGPFHDLGVFAQGGKFTLAYRNASTGSDNLNEYSVGFGVGNRGGALGFALSYVDIAGIGSTWLPAVGLIWRPDRHVSFGAAYHNFSDKGLGTHFIEKSTNVGLSLRPFGSEFLTLNGDLLFPSHHTRGYKVGVSLELIPGLALYGTYDRSGYGVPVRMAPSAVPAPYYPPYLWGNSVSLGISFNFGSHIHVEGASSYQSGAYTATYGRFEASSDEMRTIVPEGKIAEITIKGGIRDARESAFIFSKPPKNLLDYVGEIRKCGDDPSIKALILKIYPYSTSETFFALTGETQELADAVEYVRSQGKIVYAYLADDSGVDELYLASAADSVYMTPSAFIAGYGIDFNLIRLKGLFDKLHIAWNAQTAGKYKSTFHTSYTDSATPEQARLIRGLVDDIYSQMLKQIEVNRKITVDDSMKADLAALISARIAARLRLIDGVSYYDRFKEGIKERMEGAFGGLSEVDPAAIRHRETTWGRRPEVAVIGVYGTIMTGESSPPAPFPIPFLGSNRVTGSETVVRQIRAAEEDGNIKAIVLRVNSGGGSALASDEIYNAISEAKSKKPVVASFANVAASGGYYVAVGADRIFAEPATLTGSIGVVIAFPVLTDFLEKDLGSRVEEYRSGENSSVLNPLHRWDGKDMKYVDEFLDETYTDFKTKVAEGRKLSLARVDELAQGRVYTGTQAKSLSLIDDYGGLEKAIQYAADIAGISDYYRVKMYVIPGLGLGSLLRFGSQILGGYSD